MSMQVLHDAIRPDRAVRSLIEQFGAGVTLAAVVRQILAHRRSVRHAVPAEALPD